MDKRLNLRQNLGHKAGKVSDALEARVEIAQKTAKILSHNQGNDVTIGRGFDSYSVAKDHASILYSKRFEWFQETYGKFEGLYFENGGIKSIESTERKVGRSDEFMITNDFSRFRIVVPDLRTLYRLLARLGHDLDQKYWIFEVVNKYNPPRTHQTYFSGVFLYIADEKSNPDRQQCEYPLGDKERLEKLEKEIKGITKSKSIYLNWEEREDLNKRITEVQKKKLRSLYNTHDTILRQHKSMRIQQAQSHADFDILTEVQIMTQRSREISELNRPTYSLLSPRQRKGLDFSEFDSAALRATLEDWKEFFAQQK